MTATHDEPHGHDHGLSFDLATMASRPWDRRLMDRRRALQMVGGAGLVALFGCGSDDGGGAAGSSSTTTTGSPSTTAGSEAATESSDCSPIPEETVGPYPGDGSNGPNVLTEDGIVRQDIRPSFGSATGLAEGVTATLNLAILDTTNGCAPLEGAAVCVWHCDRDGQYSLYSPGATDENYLRGMQETDSAGAVSFTSIFPACYPGRWPHIHFKVYASVAEATGGAGPLATSQGALPEDVCNQAYGADGYEPERDQPHPSLARGRQRLRGRCLPAARERHRQCRRRFRRRVVGARVAGAIVGVGVGHVGRGRALTNGSAVAARTSGATAATCRAWLSRTRATSGSWWRGNPSRGLRASSACIRSATQVGSS